MSAAAISTQKVVLGDVIDIRDGTHDTPAYVESGIPLITSKNLSDAGLTFESASFISEADHAQISKRSGVQKGDVLYGMIGTIGKPTLVEVDRAFSIKNIALFKQATGVVDSKYLRWLLDSPDVNAQIARVSKGGTQKFVALGALRGLTVHLPPLEEQCRIAAILDQAETLRTQRRQALTHLDTLTQSLFLDMFGDPVMNERGWPLDKLGKQTLKMGSGSTPTGGDAAYKAEGISLIRSLNVHDGAFKYKNLAFIDDQQAAKLSNVQVEADDVLLNITGASVARVCRAPADVLPARVNQHVMIIRPKISVNCVYLERLLLSDSMKNSLLQIGGSGATREAITKAQAEDLFVPVPPLPLQQTFATRIQAIEALKATHRAALAQLDALFASLQQRAFAGELTAQASSTVVKQPAKRSFAELGQLDAPKGVESLVYAAKRLRGKGHYWPTKAQYFADKRHLELYGRSIYGETYVAMDRGPVPQAAYNASRALAEGALICEFPLDVVRVALRREGNALIALRDADANVLSAQERECLDWAIRYVKDLSFDQLQTASHDAAWQKTAANTPMAWKDIVRTLPEAAQQRFFM